MNTKEISIVRSKNITCTAKELRILIYVILGIIFVLGAVIMYLGSMIGSDIASFGLAAIIVSIIYVVYVATLHRNKRGA